jgi:hypothetical protein
MNFINSIGSSFASSVPSSGRSGGPAKVFENELTSYLQGQGLSDDQHSSIKVELQQAIQSTLNSGSRPDSGKLRSTIQGVLDNHGLDGRAFTDKFPTPPAGAGGLGIIGGTSKDDTLSQLLEILDKRSEKSRQSSGESQSAGGPDQQSAAPSFAKLDIQV